MAHYFETSLTPEISTDSGVETDFSDTSDTDAWGHAMSLKDGSMDLRSALSRSDGRPQLRRPTLRIDKSQFPQPCQDDTQLKDVSSAVGTMLRALLGSHPLDCLEETTNRYARAMLFFTKGYDDDLQAIVSGAVFPEASSELVVVRNIEFHSLCEHHLVPFSGKVTVGYVANGEVLGLSKFARIVEIYARRLQIQERLTRNIAEAVQKVLQPKGVAVRVEAVHFCMAMRGVEKSGASTVTQKFLGDLATNANVRQEWFSAL